MQMFLKLLTVVVAIVSLVCGTTSGVSGLLRATEDIITPDNVRAGYRHLTLTNNLDVLLMSDPDLDKAGAALNVCVGGQHSPQKVPGLPHFLEHLLFLGTEEYPKDGEYREFISTRGGAANAHTSEQDTAYYFNVGANYLEPALDRFAKLFISPLFNEGCIERELNAIEAEYRLQFSRDDVTTMHVLKALSKSDHPFSYFSQGNMETLRFNPSKLEIDVRGMLLKFYKEMYSANIMKLVVQGRESLDDLQKMVIEKFSAIPNYDVQIPAYLSVTLDPAYLQKMIQIQTKNDTPKLILQWEFLGRVDFMYQVSLINRQKDGGLSKYLHAKGLAHYCNAVTQHDHCNQTTVKITTALKETTPEKINLILIAIFQYLKMIRDTAPQEWYFFENRQLRELNFRFSTSKVSPYVLAQRLQYCEPKKVLRGCQMDEFDRNKIASTTRMLRDDNFLAVLISKEDIEDAREEKWFKTKYKIADLSLELLSNLASVSSNPAFKFPVPNQYIPDKPRVKMSRVDNPKERPDLIFDNEQIKFWFKQDDTWEVPIASINFLLETPRSMSNMDDFLRTKFFLELFHNSMSPTTEDAIIGGLKFDISQIDRGLKFSFSGYDQRLTQFMTNILRSLLHFTPSSNRQLHQLKENYRKELDKISSAVNLVDQGMLFSRTLNEDFLWPSKILERLPKLESESIVGFASELFSEGNLRILTHGNLMETEGRVILGILQGIFSGMKPLEKGRAFNPRSIALEPRQNVIVSSHPIQQDDSFIKIILQTGRIHDIEGKQLILLFSNTFKELFFNSLRTQKQLGYAVAAKGLFLNTVVGLSFTIQSKHDPVYLDRAIEEFLNTELESTLNEMSAEEFEQRLRTTAEPYKERPSNFSAENDDYWRQIMAGQWEFDRDQLSIECINRLTKEDLLHFIRAHILASAPERKKISFHIWGQKSAAKRPDAYVDQYSDATVFENPEDVADFFVKR